MARQGGESIDVRALLERETYVRAFVRDLAWDEHEIDDAIQEAWVRLLESPPVDPSKALAWMTSTARNALKMTARSESRRRAREASVARRQGTSERGGILDLAEIRRSVKLAAMELDEPYRTTILLRYWANLGPAEIAAHTGTPESTVKTRLTRALAILRARLDSSMNGDRPAWVLALVYSGLDRIFLRAIESPAPRGLSASGRSSATSRAAPWRRPAKLVAGLLASMLLWHAWLGTGDQSDGDELNGRRQYETATGTAGSPKRRHVAAADSSAAGDATAVTPGELDPAPRETAHGALQVKVVLDRGDGAPRPLERATVDLFDRDARGLLWVHSADDPPLRSVETDDLGRAAFEGLPPGRYWVRAQKAGATVQASCVVVRADEGGGLPEQGDTSRNGGDDPDVVRLELADSEPTSGTIEDAETGAPLSGATIDVLLGGAVEAPDGTVWQSSVAPWLTARTNSDAHGGFRVSGLRARVPRHEEPTYTFVVRREGYARAVRTIPLRELRRSDSLRFSLGRGATITGVVLDDTGAPVPHIAVGACQDPRVAHDANEWALREFERQVERVAAPDTLPEAYQQPDEAIDAVGSWTFASTDARGRFVLEGVVPRAAYVVVPSTRDHYSRLSDSPIRVAPGGSKSVEIHVTRAHALLVRIVDTERRPHDADAWIHADGAVVSVHPVVGRLATYRALVPLDATDVVVEIRGRDVTREMCAVSPDDLARGEVTVVVRAGRAIRGQLVDCVGLPVANWDVAIADCDCSSGSAETDTDGSFTIAAACSREHKLRTTRPIDVELTALASSTDGTEPDSTARWRLPSLPVRAARVVLVLPESVDDTRRIRSVTWERSVQLESWESPAATPPRVVWQRTLWSFRGDGPHVFGLFDGCARVEVSLPPLPSPGSPLQELRVQLAAQDWARITGTVMASDGAPLRHAEVHAYCPIPSPGPGLTSFSSEAHVGADGRFEFSVPPGARTVLSASREGFLRTYVQLDSRPFHDDVELWMIRARKAPGIVIGRDGEPLPGLAIAPIGELPPGLSGIAARYEVTDAEGRFSVFLPIGSTRVGVYSAPPSRSNADESDEELARRFRTWRLQPPLVEREIVVPPDDGQLNDTVIRLPR